MSHFLFLVPKLNSSRRLAQARTGTGKTLAFVIPVLQKIISVDPALEFPLFQRRHRGGEKGREREVAGDQPSRVDIRAIVISPTRELAEQIAAETRKVTRNTGIIVQTAVGGTMKREGLRKIIYEGCHLLVGTPGRLLDVLSDPYSRVSAPKLSALVLDEADRLLDDGFSKAIDEIKEHLPDLSQRDRQTLLFSATIPREVMYMVRRTMKPDFKFVRTVKEGEQETHMKVPQKLAFVKGFENLMPALVELCKREQEKLKSSEQPFKTIVYFGTKNEVALAAATFANLKSSGRNVFYPASIIEMHGKLSQAQRTKAADTFRRSESSILLSSDVTSRGMDFPNVTHVIQVGIPQQREAYVHRIGRTARGDKGGEGWLLLTDLEKVEARSRLRDLPLVLDTSLETAWIDMSQDGQLSASAAETLTQTIKASKQLHPLLKNVSYTSMLGLYATMPFKAKLVESLNARARYCWGMETPPSVSGPVAHKLGYGGMPGIVIRHSNAYNRAEASRPEFGKPSYHDLGPSGGEGYGGIGKPRGNSAMNSRAPWTGRGRVAPRRARNRDDRGGMSGY